MARRDQRQEAARPIDPSDLRLAKGKPDPLAAAGELRDDEGLLIDEYTSDAFDDLEVHDALDTPALLEPESMLTEVPDAMHGIEEVEIIRPKPTLADQEIGNERYASEE